MRTLAFLLILFFFSIALGSLVPPLFSGVWGDDWYLRCGIPIVGMFAAIAAFIELKRKTPLEVQRGSVLFRYVKRFRK